MLGCETWKPMPPNVQQITRLDNQQFGVAKYGTLFPQANDSPYTNMRPM